MARYEAVGAGPPAPVASVRVCNAETGATVDNVPMLLDSGADVPVVPEGVARALGGSPVRDYRVEGFDGQERVLASYRLRLVFANRGYVGEYLAAGQAMGILGRDILNLVRLTLDGPRLNWECRVR